MITIRHFFLNYRAYQLAFNNNYYIDKNTLHTIKILKHYYFFFL